MKCMISSPRSGTPVVDEAANDEALIAERSLARVAEHSAALQVAGVLTAGPLVHVNGPLGFRRAVLPHEASSQSLAYLSAETGARSRARASKAPRSVRRHLTPVS